MEVADGAVGYLMDWPWTSACMTLEAVAFSAIHTLLLGSWSFFLVHARPVKLAAVPSS